MMAVSQIRQVHEQTRRRGGLLVAERSWDILRAVFFCGLLFCGVGGQAQSTFQITGVLPTTVPAGANGVALTLIGTLPTAQTQAQGTNVQTCFYTGFGDASAISQGLPTQQQGGYEPVAVPASVIQGIPPANFTASNGYAVNAQVYFVPTGQPCTGSFDSSLTNSFSVPIVEPTLGAYAGPTTIPATNTAAGTPAPPPSSLTLTGSGFATGTTVSFGTFGSVTASVLSPTSLNVAVPAALASSAAGTTATLGACVPGAGMTTYCSTPAVPITLTVGALTSSNGSVTPSPSPVGASGQTTLTAQFTRGYTVSGGGAPSGTVSFTADGATVAPAPLVLDRTANFAEQRSSFTVPSAATPTITPAAGTYTSSQTVTITDATAGAAIYYTQDGSTPTTASTLYTGRFTISTTQTIQAIAAASGLLNSAAVAAAYTINLSPPTHLVFVVQPGSTATATTIAPALQVSLQDVNGNVVANATNAVTLSLGTNPGSGTLAGTTTVNAVNGIATFADLSIANIASGYTLLATSGQLTPATSNAFNITAYPINLTLQSALVGIGSTLNGTLTLSHPAPQGGVVVTLSSSTPANVTIAPATVTVAAGQTGGSFTYTGVASGDSTLSASATNYQTATVVATGTAAQVSLGTIPPVAPGQMVSLALSLAMPAPGGGTTVTFTSSAPGVATVTNSIFVPAGQRTAATNPQITGVAIGTTTITATAPGYAPATRAVTVTVVAAFSPGSTTINLATSRVTSLTISAPAQSGGITFTLSSDDATIATVPASITIVQGATSVVVPITGVANGTTTIRANSAGVTEATLPVSVSSTISTSNLATGVKLQATTYYLANLPAPSPNPVTVTVTSNDPTVFTLSKDPAVVGTAALTFPNTTNAGYLPLIYVQGQRVGTATFTVSAPGYTAGTGTITVNPSGFVISLSDFTTTTFSQPNTLSLFPAMLTPGSLAYAQSLTLNPDAGTISVPVTSATPATGTITVNPVVFHGGDSQQSTAFKPVAAGTTVIAVGAAPAGFSKPSNDQGATATVTEPAISVSGLATGAKMQSTSYYTVFVPAPPTPETITVTISDPTVATISKDPAVVGVATLTFPNFGGGYLPQIYLQGQRVGTTTLSASGAGYTSGTATMTVNPSGFVISLSDFTTTTFSQPNTLSLFPAMLTPGSLAYAQSLTLNPDAGTISVPVTSATPATGTITVNPVVFHGGDSQQSTAFKPVAAGTTVIAVGAAPAGFSKPSNDQGATATVTAPAISVGNLGTGVNLQNSNFYLVYLPAAPPSQETVTVTISDRSVAVISASPTAVGGTMLTFPVSTAGNLPQIYVQGKSVGTATLTVSAPGYTTGTGTITVVPSGFTFDGAGNFTTTTFSSASALAVYPSLLNTGSLTYAGALSLSPGVASVSVAVSSSNSSIGTVTTPLIFHAGDSSQTTMFQPVSSGSTVISLGTPAGYSIPGSSTQLTATVTAPVLVGSDVVTGVHMETTRYYTAYVPVAPPNPVTVTVTSNGPAIATLSKDATVVGTTTITFPNVTAAGYLPSIYVQGQSVGTTTLTISAPGYSNGTVNVTVDPSGFAFDGAYSSGLSATAGGSSTTLNVNSYILNPGSLANSGYTGLVNPDVAPLAVTVTSSNAAVGTITTSPLMFSGGSGSQTTSFAPVSAGTTTLTVQPPAGFSTPSQNQQVTATVQ